MSLRARFVRWMGIALGVMEPIKQFKEKPMEQRGFSMDQIAAVVGTKELELIALRLELANLRERLKKYEPQENVVPIEGAKA